MAVAALGCSSAPPASNGPPPKSTAPCDDPAVLGAPLATRCGQLIDSAGRVVFLRGVNARVAGVFDVTFSDGRAPLEPIPAFSASDAAEMRDFGFDALRLPVNWSGIEPTKNGGFDSAYLDRVATAVQTAASAGLRVLIDFHQDAYSKEIGEDGAPLWAIQPPPTKLLGGPLTNLTARRLSAQVIDAFNTFFGTSSEGATLRSRFTQMAVHVAKRFADDPNVIGFEIFNEPETDDAGVRRLNQAAYAKMRAAAPDKLYAFEPSVTRNLTDQASLAKAPLGSMTTYSPHVYTDAFTATPTQLASLTKETLRRSNANARNEADSWHAPLVITEWGFDPNAVNADNYVSWQSELQEQYQASSFFWLWKEESQGNWGCFDHDAKTGAWTERAALKKALARVRPEAVAGWPKSFSFDRASGVFQMQFVADPTVKAPHLISVAPVLGSPSAVTCDGKPVHYQSEQYGVLSVICGQGTSSEHTLGVRVAPAP